MEHCCKKMDYYATEKNSLVEYSPETRTYDFILQDDSFGTYQGMYYCPWCGKKLPKTLGEEWCKVIKENLGLDYVFAEEWATLPEEFKTDEWWKKRGL